MADKIVFLDLEMTGLDINHNRIIELGALVTDWELDFIAEFESPIYTPLVNLLKMDEVVREMHTANGLLEEVAWAPTLSEVERSFITFLDELELVTQGNILIAGYSVQFDKEWIRRWMPDLHALLHWRILDISTLRSMVHHWTPHLQVSQVTAHRALPDCYEARNELRAYREKLFI